MSLYVPLSKGTRPLLDAAEIGLTVRLRNRFDATCRCLEKRVHEQDRDQNGIGQWRAAAALLGRLTEAICPAGSRRSRATAEAPASTVSAERFSSRSLLVAHQQRGAGRLLSSARQIRCIEPCHDRPRALYTTGPTSIGNQFCRSTPNSAITPTPAGTTGHGKGEGAGYGAALRR
jgi:hypothetical protein